MDLLKNIGKQFNSIILLLHQGFQIFGRSNPTGFNLDKAFSETLYGIFEMVLIQDFT